VDDEADGEVMAAGHRADGDSNDQASSNHQSSDGSSGSSGSSHKASTDGSGAYDWDKAMTTFVLVSRRRWFQVRFGVGVHVRVCVSEVSQDVCVCA
jgi:hypothetical protein